jgi:hypothetical protein
LRANNAKQSSSSCTVTAGSNRGWTWTNFTASHRFLDEEEAAAVIRYEHRNRFLGPIVRAGFGWLVGWKYHASETDRRRLVS